MDDLTERVEPIAGRAGERSAVSPAADSPHPPFTASLSDLAALNGGTVEAGVRSQNI